MSKRQQDIEDASLARDRTRYRDARDEYRRCQVSSIAGRGFHAIARDYGIPPVWLRPFNKGEYQASLDSIDVDDDSSDEKSSTGDFSFLVGFSSAEQFLILCWCGAANEHGRVSPCTCLATNLALDIFLY